MNRAEFINTLTKELEKNRIIDLQEIIADFNEHFDFKLEEGKTEEEICKKIGNPIDIANDYLKQSSQAKKATAITKIGLGIVDFFFSIIYITTWLSVITIFAFAIALFALSITLIFRIDMLLSIVPMPFMVSLLMGISVFSLSIVTTIGGIHMYLYTKQWGKAYLRWHKNLLNNFIYPPLSVHPMLDKKKASKYKLIMTISTLLFVIIFIIAYLVASVNSGSFEFWHVWGWFV